jgi:hypothetical protein
MQSTRLDRGIRWFDYIEKNGAGLIGTTQLLTADFNTHHPDTTPHSVAGRSNPFKDLHGEAYYDRTIKSPRVELRVSLTGIISSRRMPSAEELTAQGLLNSYSIGTEYHRASSQ